MNPIDPALGVTLNQELAVRGLELELHRTWDNDRRVTAIRFHAGGLIVFTAITFVSDANELAQEAINLLRKGVVA